MATKTKTAKMPAGTAAKAPVSDARRAANLKWDRENMVTIGCRITKKRAAEFKEACDQLGITRNAVLLQAITTTIHEAAHIKLGDVKEKSGE